MRYEWNHAENDTQEYYDTIVNDDYLCVFRNKSEEAPNTWIGVYQKNGCGVCTIYNKTFNDRQRKRLGVGKNYSLCLLPRVRFLTNSDPLYMQAKVEHCYRNDKVEVSA